MKVLAFDCSGASCSAAVVIDDETAAQRFVPMERGHAETLLPMIETVLREAALTPAALDLLAVTIGPGSFTGLRIGLAAGRGLALARKVPAIGVPSFDVVMIAEDSGTRPLFIVLESKRAELFVQRRDRADPRLPALVPPEEWAAILPPGPCCLAGNGAARLAAAVGRSDIAVLPGHGLPDPVALARLGAARWQAGDRTELAPLYLRAPDTTTPRHAALVTP
ncbi:MAG TPA: tRNA (adenosine(37)-N6)-threonylcarbamoyltransferase complex dimerization subunit type 1 TsaB [Stellaceae bacterium]|jgi:tRNA threonylcarbamoyladenosine biosynthesis protein TsaB|nr:tRNA (adenosine(37)-N6)-threonylcarbamoyltransferase complex dimerization subunit type 1 TsaB [Stellaceae bacterium]